MLSLLFAASAPPLSRTALPDLRASEATCGMTSGRDSNTTAITPSGQDSLCKIKPWSSSVTAKRFSKRVRQVGDFAHASGHLTDATLFDPQP